MSLELGSIPNHCLKNLICQGHVNVVSELAFGPANGVKVIKTKSVLRIATVVYPSSLVAIEHWLKRNRILMQTSRISVHL